MRRLLRLAIVLIVGLSPWLFASVRLPQAETPAEKAAELAERLTPEEKVGQLMLVTFSGAEAPPESQIYELITRYHVGGVVLRKENNNLVERPDTLPALLALINQLQTAEWEDSRQPRTIDVETGETIIPVYVPLLVGIEHGGDGLANSSFASGVTTLPSAMAMGAAWDPDLAQSIGELAGRELSALGINLLLGPDLDVLEIPDPEAPGDLGARTFGGDPFWVGEMGRAYVRGLHVGSEGRLAVFPRHFPGLGSSNRRADEEVPTVRKTLDELKLVELAPFFAVTGREDTREAVDPVSTADGVITAHIRFQGLQGNIRATTRPVSFDQQALQLLTSLPEFAGWREGGGLLMSDSLGVNSVKRFYGAAYIGRLVAKDALVAGNDLLYLSRFQSPDDPDDFTTIKTTLAFFAQKYGDDDAFAQLVDEALLRVLQLKFQLYPRFASELVLKSGHELDELGQSQDQVFAVAREAASLISPPSAAELAERLPDKPQSSERVVILTDVRTYFPCDDCAPVDPLPVDALEQAVLKLYGPEGSREVRPGNWDSFSYQELQSYLDGTAVPPPVEEGTPPPPIPIEAALDRADWVIFLQLDLNPDVPWSGVLKKMLAERPDIYRLKKVVVFAFGAPYYLDTTEITNLSAYFGMYSQAPAFVELAARLLFQEVNAPGASPVSVAGVGYDLFAITRPNPDQIIPLMLDLPPEAIEATPDAPRILAPPLEMQPGDQVNLLAGPILDHNGHLVPDGTVARFSEHFPSGNIPPLTIEATTVGGVARASFSLVPDWPPGLHEFRVSSDPALDSQTLQISVSVEESTGVAPTTTPTSSPTATPLPPTATSSPTPTETPVPPTPTPLPTESPSPPPPPPPLPPPPWVTLGDLLVALAGSGGLALVGYRLGQLVPGQAHTDIRLALAAVIGALLGYNYFALGLAGSEILREALAGLTVILITLSGGAVGLGLGWLWFGLVASGGRGGR